MGISGSQPAYSMAQGGVMRGSSSRGNVHTHFVFVAIDGVQYATARANDDEQVDNETLSISENEGETPNTAAFQVRGFQPTAGQEVVITQGSINNLQRLFAGTVMSDQHGYTGTPANGKDQINVIDFTWQLTRGTISRRWRNVSATTIAQEIIADADRDFDTDYIEAGLPTLDEFTVTNQTHAKALGALCERIGASYWKTTYDREVWLGLGSTNETDPTELTETSAPLVEMKDLSVTRDLSQVITRQPVEGGGANALTLVVAGETILPLTDGAWYNEDGGTVVSGPQRITYTGLDEGGAGSLVGPGRAPSTIYVNSQTGSGIDAGVHSWAVTWKTAAGETLPSPVALATMRTLVAPGAPDAVSDGVLFAVPQGPSAGRSVQYALALRTLDGAGTGVGTPAAAYIAVGNHWPRIDFTVTSAMVSASVPAEFTDVRLLKNENGAGWVEISSNLMNYLNSPTGAVQTFYDTMSSATYDFAVAHGTTFVAPASAVSQQALVYLQVGPTGVTQRRLWRTAAGGSQLKLAATIADNTTTTITDSGADSGLGVNVPTSDTSGLTQPAGQVNAGSTTLLAAAASSPPFETTGGWVIAGDQVIRYTGISGGSLTGIPASGPGSIVSSLPYGSTLTAAAQLTGIPASGAGAILYDINEGDPVNLRVVVDDLAAQATIGALLGDDGIIEGALIQDGRISETEAIARGYAQLALRKDVAVTASYVTRDKNTHATREQSFDLDELEGTLRLQSVTIDNFHPSRWQTHHAQASSKRFSLEMLLRLARSQ